MQYVVNFSWKRVLRSIYFCLQRRLNYFFPSNDEKLSGWMWELWGGMFRRAGIEQDLCSYVLKCLVHCDLSVVTHSILTNPSVHRLLLTTLNKWRVRRALGPTLSGVNGDEVPIRSLISWNMRQPIASTGTVALYGRIHYWMETDWDTIYYESWKIQKNSIKIW